MRGIASNLRCRRKLGNFETKGSTAVFEIVVDDYAEIWVNGSLPAVVGSAGGHFPKGFNSPNRVVVGKDVQPGQQYIVAVFAANGPMSNPPANYIWIRSATLDFYNLAASATLERLPRTSSAPIPASIPSSQEPRKLKRSPMGSRSLKVPCGSKTKMEVTSSSVTPMRTQSIDGRLMDRYPSIGQRAVIPELTSANIFSLDRMDSPLTVKVD